VAKLRPRPITPSTCFSARDERASANRVLVAGPELASTSLSQYELYIYKQWLRVYMRSKMIKHNKDMFESLDDPLALLEKLHIY
jgi:hypothetical protein